MKFFVSAFFACIVLAACAEVDPVSSPNKFGFSVWGGDIKGRFNPKGFNSSQVRSQIARGCLTNPEIIDYVEAPVGGGLVGFTAECRVSKLVGDSYDYVVERTPNGFSLTSASMITFP